MISEYDPVFEEWTSYPDPNFEELYIANSVVVGQQMALEAEFENLSAPTNPTTATDPVESSSTQPATQPTTAEPTTVPTTAAPTTQPTTAPETETLPAGSYRITIHSPQGIFNDAYVTAKPGEFFNIVFALRTEYHLSDCTISATYDPSQMLIGAYVANKTMPDPTTNRLNGEYRFVLGTGAEMVDTTTGGPFLTFRAKALDALDHNQTLNIVFETLRLGRYTTVYDDFLNTYVNQVDPSFEVNHISFSEVVDRNFELVINGDNTPLNPTTQPTTAEITTQPTTAEPTTQPTTAAPTTQPVTDPTEATTSAPTTEPTTAAPTTKPTTATQEPTTEPTTATQEPTTEPTTATQEPSTQPPTVWDGKYQITVKSAQGIFPDAVGRYTPGDKFMIELDLKTSTFLLDGELTASYDSSQLRLGAYSSSKRINEAVVNQSDGSYRVTFENASELIDTTNGGEFMSIRGITRATMNSDQVITIDFSYLDGGRYNISGVDPSYKLPYINNGAVAEDSFTLSASLVDYVEPPTEPTTEPTTAEPTTEPTTAEPTTEPTTAEPTTEPATAEPTTEPTTAEPTPADNKFNITVRSAQGIFRDSTARFLPGEKFDIRVSLNAGYPVKELLFSANYDPSQIRVGSYNSTNKMNPTISQSDGKYGFYIGSGETLVETSSDGYFLVLKGIALNSLSTDQVITIDVSTLKGGQYTTDNEGGKIVDKNYEYVFIDQGVSMSHNYRLTAIIAEYTEPATEAPTTEPTTAEPTTEPTTAEPTTEPTEATEPTTEEPTTEPTEATEPTTEEPTTAEPTTEEPSTAEPTTEEPTTEEPTTAEPTTEEPSTAEPTTEEPTAEPTTEPATAEPTQAPTQAPTNAPAKAPEKINNLNGTPSEDSAVDFIKGLKNDKDPSGSSFSLLRANSKKVSKNSITVKWTKVKGAKKYIIMGNKCGKAYKKIKITTKLSFTQKKLKKGTYYKYMILAVNSKGKVIAISKTLHVATKGGKVGNYKSVKITNAKSTLKFKKGKKFTLKAKAIKADKKVRNHRKIKFESTKPNIVKVTAGGKITAKKKGTAVIYAYAQNGVYKKLKVKVS